MSYNYVIQKSIQNILSNAVTGKFPLFISGRKESALIGDGLSINIGENTLTSATPSTRNITTLSPEASILIKKKAFSSFKANNDLKFMDKTEKMLLRSTKALFAYKCAQIRAYESLTKFQSFFKTTHQINLSLFVDLLNSAELLTADADSQAKNILFAALDNTFSDLAYDDYKEDILKIIKRNAFASDNRLTTWVVDPDSTDNYDTGPGTGVIDLCIFTDFNTTTDLQSSPSSASFTAEDPYRILTITEDDIELAIDEAINGTIGLLSALASGDPDAPMLDTSSIASAIVESVGLGFLDDSLDISYIRNRLRVFYLGKPIVNPGDAIHFYIKGNKSLEDFSNNETAFDESYIGIDESILEAERVLYTNQKIDLDTYKKLRKHSENSFGMQHVFGGFITNTSETFAAGKWVLKADCRDNMGWLQWGRLNFEPAIDDPQGVLEDPLTPYEIKTDESGRILSASGPQLLDENKYLLKTGLLKYDSGILNGQIASESNLLQGQYNSGGSLRGAKIMQHPSGFVYRWKEGIITATANLSIVDPVNEDTVSARIHRQAYGLPVTSTDSSAMGALNNLDIANILSILIVGQPYNVETFIEQAYIASGLTMNSSGSLDPTNHVTSILDASRKQNRYLGNFRPYRLITMSSQTLSEGTNSYALRTQANNSIEVLRNRKLYLNKVLKDVSNSPATGGASGLLARSVQAEIADINKSIDNILKPFQNTKIDATDEIINGINILDGGNSLLPTVGNTTFDRDLIRSLTLVGAQRRIEDVRLNRDSNLFIVSDQYDDNTDIRPYLLKFRDSGYKVFNSIYASIYEKCESAAAFMNLEFFCNPQGHLEFRPPQWNRTPHSVLKRLFEIKKGGIVPDFLRDLFGNRTESIRREIHYLNVKIAILALLMGKYPDKSLIPGMKSTGAPSLSFFGISEDTIEGQESINSLELKTPQTNFLKSISGTLGDIQNLDNQLLGNGLSVKFTRGEEGDILAGNTSILLGVFDAVTQELDSGIFDNIANTIGSPGGISARKIARPENLNAIRTQMIKLGGLDPSNGIISEKEFTISDFIFAPGEESRGVAKLNKYLSALKVNISERDKLVELLQRNEEKQKELEELESTLSGEFTSDDDDNFLVKNNTDFEESLSNLQNSANTLRDIVSGDINNGTLFDHLIEDDSKNLKGPGSGKRYIIEDHDIISCTFTETPPTFTRIDVVGNAPIVGEGLNRGFEEKYYWAGATDFDLWRQYGYVHKQVSLPFSSSAELQSRPFAIMELQLQRANIQQASLSVAGNEYYEPGDVVFVKSKGLLYYVTSVSHQFGYESKDFSTSLSLINGHPPGEYLPSPLDIIGQQLTKDPLSSQLMVYRNSNGDDRYRELRPDCAILFPNNTDITSENVNLLLDHKDNMIRFANMMIELNTLLIGNKKVLLRGFVRYTDDINKKDVLKNMSIIKSLLLNPQMITQFDSSGMGDDFLDSVGQSVTKSLGMSSGSTKGLTNLVLPNGLQAAPIKPESIIEQLVILNGEDTASNNFEIKCMNQDILAASNEDNILTALDQNGTALDQDGIFPRGGPKQKTWLDFRDDLTKLYKIVEIGILDISREL